MPLQSRSANEQKGYDIFIAVSYHQGDSEKQRDLAGCKRREEDGSMMEQRGGTQPGRKQIMQKRVGFVKRNKQE